MKKIYKILTVVGIGAVFTGNVQADLLQEAAALDVKKVCDVKANGADAVIAVAAKFNPEAVKQGVEFKRLGITNSNYIKYTEMAIKAKSKETVIEYKSKGKMKTKKFPTEYAAWRACHFSVRALQQKIEAEDTWRLAVPGDGFKF